MKDDGGQAFPRAGFESAFHNSDKTDTRPHKGMTLRQWYAGQSMQAFITAIRGNGESVDFKEVAEASFEQADAMIKEGEK